MIPVNPYNSVGLIVAVGEVILWLTMLLFLREPPAKEKSTLKGSNAEQTGRLVRIRRGWELF